MIAVVFVAVGVIGVGGKEGVRMLHHYIVYNRRYNGKYDL